LQIVPTDNDELGVLAPATGTLIAGKYRVERVVGRGGMGVVLAARHEELDQLVAIKLLRSDIDRGDVAVARFLREARAAARIESDHVARVFDVGTLDTGHAYMVMEHLEGRDLEAVLASRGALPVEEAVDHVLEALEAVAQAHAHGIVHRDLKPSNLFLARRPDGSQRIKVLDFGISKLMKPPGLDDAPGTLTGAGTILGTPGYMSPEQLKSSKSVDVRSDVWAIGVIVHELVSGVPPFGGETVGELFAAILDDPPTPLRTVRSDAPAALEAVVTRCLTRDRALRFPDVGALAAALAPFGSARTAALPGKIAMILGHSDAVPATTARITLASSPEDWKASEMATTADSPATPAAPEAKRSPAMGTASTWTQRARDAGGPRRWAVPLATLGVGLLAGIWLAWHVLGSGPDPAAHAVAAPGPSAVAGAPAPVAEAPGAVPVASVVVPTVVPAASVVEPAPRPSATSPAPSAAAPRPAAPRASAAAKPAAPRKSPAELMKERD
jgi:serine/threonine-protein kinase